MKRKTAGRVAKPKVCAFCGANLAERRPVYLVSVGMGEIIGPYHAGCAERLALVHKGKPTSRSIPGESLGRILPVAREETLPW